jgi:hypothetical protein
MTSNQMRVGDCMHAGIVSCAADAMLVCAIPMATLRCPG